MWYKNIQYKNELNAYVERLALPPKKYIPQEKTPNLQNRTLTRQEKKTDLSS